ncbi:MAG: hypothetical protein AAFP67_01995 [Pseudomonadota bacterium]
MVSIMWKQTASVSAVTAFILLTVSVNAHQSAVEIDDLHDAVPPTALLCEEQSATLRDAGTLFSSTRPDFTDQFALVSDPSQTCLHPDVQAAAHFETSGGSCYMLRTIGAGEADRPLSCIERHSGDPAEGAPVASLRCSGFEMRVNAHVGGGFSTHLRAEDQGFTRKGLGTCQRY